MASLVSHVVASLGIGACFYKPEIPKRVWVMGAACSMIPDLDVVGFRFGIRYGDFWGHRGFTHSILFAASVAAIIVLFRFRVSLPEIGRLSIWTYFFLATISHGLLDAMTDGGLGVAFFSPFNNQRYFLPWTPIRVSPMGVGRFFTSRGISVIQSELVWVWIPAGLMVALVLLLRRRRSANSG